MKDLEDKWCKKLVPVFQRRGFNWHSLSNEELGKECRAREVEWHSFSQKETMIRRIIADGAWRPESWQTHDRLPGMY